VRFNSFPQGDWGHFVAKYDFSNMRNNSPTVLDLFCGAGGLSLGFNKAGFKTVFAADHNPAALQTYSKNFGHAAHDCDLSDPKFDFPKADVIVGGPPCQGFSSAGMRRNGDHRNNLVLSFAQTVARMRPEAFLFENVEGFLTAENGDRVIDLLEPLLAAGYRIHLRKINAANYGVPQHRKRVIAVGGLHWEPTFACPSHTAFGAPGALLASAHLPLTTTIAGAIEGLPAASSEPPGCPQGHWFRQLTGADMERAKAMKPGMTMRDLPEELHHPSYRRRAFRRVMDGTPTERRGGAPAGLRRLRPDEPSKAITGGARNEFLHPTEDRPLTMRECARLQTFPDDFIFCGTPSEQDQLIGNAVPPALALAIASTLKEDLFNEKTTKKEGALLTFVPTMAEGCSPALKYVTDSVNSKFEQYVQSQELLLWP
jgi:DNA (cytosine-5)-methyltransferase 1